jgi:hypothetical protein
VLAYDPWTIKLQHNASVAGVTVTAPDLRTEPLQEGLPNKLSPQNRIMCAKTFLAC